MVEWSSLIVPLAGRGIEEVRGSSPRSSTIDLVLGVKRVSVGLDS